uniref:LRR-RLK n=1 Tax=Vernicia fordii TaxID=73154 RepID=A0A127AUE0_VERFO|nr:LRR-RLK [Vernicia fordii]
MSRLSVEQVLKDKQSRDPTCITCLSLTHKALSDVSCLSEFSNLERLDLASNTLTSLEGLRLCVNLKWLSVVQNKLESLKGIEGLYKLTVLNAGKNKLKFMDEVRSLVSLRALILNDNEIVSICKLDENKELNTLVLSRNPIREIGQSLVKVVKLLPSLHIFNARPIDRSAKKGDSGRVDDVSPIPASEPEVVKQKKKGSMKGNMLSEHEMDQSKSSHLDNVSGINVERDLKEKKKKMKGELSWKEEVPVYDRDDIMVENKLKRKASQEQDNDNDLDREDLKHKRKQTIEKFLKKDVLDQGNNKSTAKKKPKSKKSREGQSELDVIDNGETSFADFFAANAVESPKHGGEEKMIDKVGEGINFMGASVAFSAKKKKIKNRVGATVQLSAEVEVGMGGPSTWGD